MNPSSNSSAKTKLFGRSEKPVEAGEKFDKLAHDIKLYLRSLVNVCQHKNNQYRKILPEPSGTVRTAVSASCVRN